MANEAIKNKTFNKNNQIKWQHHQQKMLKRQLLQKKAR
jgi:hypothetical protein